MSAPRVNDFAFKIATPNGSGSASANALVMQAIFRMGVPVAGKNLFPSNIQGLPTWYEIRVSKDRHLGRNPDFDLLVALNPATYARDVAEVRSGGWLLYDSTWPLPETLRRPDVTLLGVPLAKMCNEAFHGGRERILMKNIAYVGVLAALFELDMEIIRGLLGEKYGKKQALVASNQKAIDLGYGFAKETFPCPLPIRLAKMDETAGSILIDGNTASALGAVFAGATVGAWYPITPSTSLMEGFKAFCKRFREDKDGTKRYCILQAEDELAALGMVIGAAWAGARAFTPTSGPGISLMNELVGLAYYTEIPAVIFDVQRAGPSTGMPTRTQQGDLLLAAYASHGDTKHICLYPANPEECFRLTVNAFDLADRFQTPVFVLSDLDIGMNDWMCPRFTWDDSYQPDRGKVLSPVEIEGLSQFYRYFDRDGDHIAARTLPGSHPKGGYFARGSGHNRFGRYTEEEAEYVDVVDRLAMKIDSAAAAAPAPVVKTVRGARAGIITIGSCEEPVLEAVAQLGRRGMALDYLRVRAFPFARSVAEFIAAQEEVFVVEQNRDAQLSTLLRIETGVAAERLRSIRTYGGLPMSAQHVVDGVEGALRLQKAS